MKLVCFFMQEKKDDTSFDMSSHQHYLAVADLTVEYGV